MRIAILLSLLFAVSAVHGDVIINEFQSSNTSTISDAGGDYSDWIELYNAGQEPVNLSGYGLTDDAASPYKWIFPPVVVEPASYLLIWASGKDSTNPAGDLHTDFRIDADGETLVLTRPDGTTASEAPAQALAPDQSFGRCSDDAAEWCVFSSPTPGAANRQTAPQSIVINEVMALNISSYPDASDEYPDWVELYNPTDAPISLAGWGLSDDADKPFKWIFPVIEVAAGGRLIVFASGDASATTPGELHAGIKIGADGESVVITAPDSTRVDASPPVAMRADVSYGRAPDGSATWRFFSPATPGEPNSETGYTGILDKPTLSHAPGFSTAPFELTITAPESTVVRYTDDGSEPTETSPVYVGPVHIEDRSGPPSAAMCIRTTTQGYPWHMPSGDVFRGTVIRAKAFRSRWLPSSTTTATYLINALGPSRYTLPVVSLSTDPHGLFDPEDGVYVPGPQYSASTAPYTPEANFHRRGEEWELPIYMELFEPDGTVALAQDAGMRISGNWAREYHQKSLRIHARSRYGDDDFDYRLFPNREPKRYRSFQLRTASSDVRWGMIRDAMIQELSGHLGFDTQACRPVIVFLNGDYWGIQFMRERYDEDYLEGRYGVDPEEVDLIEIDGGVQVDAGDATHYDSMMSYLQSSSMLTQAAYDHIATLMDVENFTRYYAAQIIAANNDWPHKNVRLWRARTPMYESDADPALDGRWRWMMFDTERGFALRDASQASANVVEWAANTLTLGRMLKNPTFRTSFINELANQSNTAFLPERVIRVIDSLATQIEPEMPEHIARWGEPVSMEFWQAEVQKMRDFATLRPAYMRQHVTARFSLTGSANVTLNVEGPSNSGTISISGTPITSSTPGVTDQPYPWSGTYYRNVPLELVATARPGYHFAGWSGVASEIESRDTISVRLDGDTIITARFSSEMTQVTQSDESLQFGLAQNAPNPFNPVTSLRFSIPEACEVLLAVYDVNGRLVRNLVSGMRDAGHHEATWDGADDTGRSVASGVYIVGMTAGNFHTARRVTLVR